MGTSGIGVILPYVLSQNGYGWIKGHSRSTFRLKLIGVRWDCYSAMLRLRFDIVTAAIAAS
jgi:hypothetical protein